MGKLTALPRGAARAAAPRRKKRTGRITPSQRAEGNEGPVNKHWRTFFVQELAKTSHIGASAAAAGVSLSRVYKTRREDPAFAGQWRAALLEGYDHLEMELLGHLRDPRPERKMDVPSALRLLAAHRATVERERALREDDDEQAVLESIDSFLEDMRQRRLANTAILAGTGKAANDDAD
jgi:hypothetical protein